MISIGGSEPDAAAGSDCAKCGSVPNQYLAQDLCKLVCLQIREVLQAEGMETHFG